jgi:hypothetical protein
MGSQQKNYIYTDQDGDRLMIAPPISASKVGCATVSMVESPTVFVNKEDAPRVAAELLRAAGWQGYSVVMVGGVVESNVGMAIDYLEAAASDFDRRKHEQAEQAELEAEALKLYNTVQGRTCTDFPVGMAYGPWVEAAKVARQMHQTEAVIDCGG